MKVWNLLPILLATALPSRALNEESPVEVTCGVVYSIGAFPAHGGWPGPIENVSGRRDLDYLLHLFYAPFVMVHNPGGHEITYGSDDLSGATIFGSPRIGLRFERLSGIPVGFLTNQPVDISLMYVWYRNSYRNKTYHFHLSDTEGDPSITLQPGETKVYVPDMDENYTFNLDRPGDGNTFYDWRSDKTQNIQGLSNLGWRGHRFAYHVDWLLGNANGTNNNGLRGIIPTAIGDTWNVEVSTTDDLGAFRIYRYPLPSDGSWPTAMPDEWEITTFPFQTKDTGGAFSTSSVFTGYDDKVKDRKLRPIFAITAPPQTSSLNAFTDRDGNGMDDDWEYAHFGAPGASTSEDPDGDGFPNFEESLAGTSPVDAKDFLRAEVSLIENHVEFKWKLASWRHYEIQESENMTDWTTVRTIRTKQTTDETGAETFDLHPDTPKFYRIRVWR